MAMQHHAKKHCNLHQITLQFASFRCVFCLKSQLIMNGVACKRNKNETVEVLK